MYFDGSGPRDTLVFANGPLAMHPPAPAQVPRGSWASSSTNLGGASERGRPLPPREVGEPSKRVDCMSGLFV